MRRTGGRLSVAETLGRSGQLDSLSMETNSATTAKAEREIKRLKLENQKLKADLNDTRSLYNQLMQENPHERFDERRVMMLKSQVIQLERQVLVLNEAISSRGEVLVDIENSLTWLADRCRGYITMDVRGPCVNVERSDLTLMVETAESARIKLYKQIESKTTDRLGRPLKFYNDFIHPTREDNLTLLEVASGNLEHINLKHVTQLESNLSVLYRELIHLHQLMEEDPTTGDNSCLWTSSHMITTARERLTTQMLKTCALTKDCTSDLLDLSLLLPSAPWPPMKKSALKDITAERVLDSLPPFPRSKAQDGHQLIHALVKAYNYKVYMLNNKILSLREDVKYHQKVYNLQLKYTESLFQAIREAYTAFEESSNDLIVKPLKGILEAYVTLNQTASEAALKRFLSTFKDNASQLNDIVETIAVKPFEESEGSKVLSQFGEEFFESLEKVVKEQQSKRDREARKVEDIREEQKRLDHELRELLEEQDRRVIEKMARFESVNDDLEVDRLIDNRNDKNIDKLRKRGRKLDKSNDDSLDILSDRSEDKSKKKSDRLSHRDRKSDLNGDESGRLSERKDSSPVGRLEKENSDLRTERQNLKTSAGKPKQTQLHKKEWVNLFDRSDSPRTEDSDKNVVEKNHEEQQEYFINTLRDNNEPNDSVTPLNEDPKPSDKPPVKVNKKKKLNYVPNTFVPNRTLQLRRSGSLTRLSSAEKLEQKLEDNLENSSKDSADFIDNHDLYRQRSFRSQSQDRIFPQQPSKSRPPFR